MSPRKGEYAISVGCGNMHTACVASSGNLYTWGSNEYGQLGKSKDRVLQVHTIIEPVD